jgi:hypothetical protein
MLCDDQGGTDVTGCTLSSGINGIYPMATSVQARREDQVVANCSRGRNGESGAGFEPAG